MYPPTRGALFADLEVELRTMHLTPQGASLQVTLPPDYEEMAQKDCTMNYKYTSCTASGLFFNVILGEDIPSNMTIRLKVRNNAKVPNVELT
jgi:hypothetical protein